jgi:hypothetical protein
MFDGSRVIEGSSPCPSQARVSCAPLRGASVDSSQAVGRLGIDLKFSQSDPPEHQGEDRGIDGAGAPDRLLTSE